MICDDNQVLNLRLESAMLALQLIVKSGNRMLMISAKMPSETAFAGGTVYDIFSGTVIIIGIIIPDLGTVIPQIYQVEICGGNVKRWVSEISRNGQCLQKDLRSDHR